MRGKEIMEWKNISKKALIPVSVKDELPEKNGNVKTDLELYGAITFHKQMGFYCKDQTGKFIAKVNPTIWYKEVTVYTEEEVQKMKDEIERLKQDNQNVLDLSSNVSNENLKLKIEIKRLKEYEYMYNDLNK